VEELGAVIMMTQELLNRYISGWLSHPRSSGGVLWVKVLNLLSNLKVNGLDTKYASPGLSATSTFTPRC
jgi:hypothetical protein